MKVQHVRNAAIAVIAGIGLMATPLYADMQGKGMEKGAMGDQKGGMTQMSGIMGKGMTMDAEQQQKMTEMRKKMDTMHKSAAPGTPAKKPAQHLHPRDGK